MIRVTPLHQAKYLVRIDLFKQLQQVARQDMSIYSLMLLNSWTPSVNGARGLCLGGCVKQLRVDTQFLSW